MANILSYFQHKNVVISIQNVYTLGLIYFDAIRKILINETIHSTKNFEILF